MRNKHRVERVSGKFHPNSAQKKAIEFPITTPLKVIAGAGTGKTELLTRRFIHLVKHFQLKPHRILALTFTKKAAAEMKRRILQSLFAEGLLEKSEAALLQWIGNFHSVSLKLLKQNPIVAGLDPAFEIVDETEQKLILGEIVQDFLDCRLSGQAGVRFEGLMIDSADELVESMLVVVGRLKTHLVEPSQEKELKILLKQQYQELSTMLLSTIENTDLPKNTRKAAEKRLARLDKDRAYEELFSAAVFIIYKDYQERLAERDLLDFNDLISHSLKLARSTGQLKRKFDYILVDEFQDTDHGQYCLLEALSQDLKNVTVVGDRKQLIYEWREAKLENLDRFPGEEIALEENYRSYEQVLSIANGFIKKTMEGEPPLRSALKGGLGLATDVPVKLFRAQDRLLEARFVAREIRGLLDEGCSSGNIAILMRGIYSAEVLEEALEAEHIPFETVGGCGFYDLKETKDVAALLRLICNPFDDQAMARVLQSDLVGLSNSSMHVICSKRKNETPSIYDVIKSCQLTELRPDSRKKVQGLVTDIAELARAKWLLPLGELFSRILQQLQYLKYLSSEEGLRGPRFKNVAQFYKLATGFEERHPHAHLEEFLEYLELTLTSYSTTTGDLASDKVHLMTIHQAKGLEFTVVFVVGVVPTSFPSRFRGGNFGYEPEFGIYARKHPDGEALVRYDGAYGFIEPHVRARAFSEENRVMYVAMTRAKNLLYITSFGDARDEDSDFFSTLERLSEQHPDSVIHVSPEDVDLSERELSGEREEVEAGDRQLSIPDILQSAVAARERIIRGSRTRETPARKLYRTTYSKLALFRQCARRYALKHLYQFPVSLSLRPEEVPSKSYGAALGNVLHQTLMHYHRCLRENEQVDAIELFLRCAKAHEIPRKMMSAGQEMMQRYLHSRLSAIPTLFEEREFQWRMDNPEFDLIFEGKIDRIHRENDGSLRIVDYKSGSPDPTHDRVQLALYRMATEAALDEIHIQTSNYYLSSGEEVEYEFSRDELGAIRSDFIRDARMMAEGKFSLNPEERERSACLKCEFRKACEREG